MVKSLTLLLRIRAIPGLNLGSKTIMIVLLFYSVPPGECQDMGLPNVVFEWLTSLLRIRDVPGSNLGTETGYLEVVHGFT
jgi:hypothetical protein